MAIKSELCKRESGDSHHQTRIYTLVASSESDVDQKPVTPLY